MNLPYQYKIYPDVMLGKDSSIGEFVIIGLPSKGQDSLKTSIGNNALVRSHTVIYAGNIIGNDFQTGHGVLVRECSTIGDNVSIGSGSVVEHHVKIGNNVRLHSNVFVPEFSVLEDECWLGPHVVLTNAMYPRSKKSKENLQGPVIKRAAKISANATILPGIVIGENALVGAGAVVTKDVPPYSIVVGNPASVIKDVRELVYENNPKEKVYDF
jgi:acetyltransferase-like isoleucine patch superfamily enzyme